eukprot:s4105_g3.t1
MPDPDPPQETPEPEEEEEENQDDTDETIPYGSTDDSDDTLDYNDLVIEDDDKTWCFLTQEQKICSNTASFSVPRLIDGSPIQDVAVPDDFDDDEPDPDAGPSGHNGPPILPTDGDEPFNPAPMPDPDPPQETPEPEEEEEENQDDTDETIPYGSTDDSDDTLDYNDLVIEDDDKTWWFLTQEQKICSDTASFSVPRLIDGSPIQVGSVSSSSSIGMSYSVLSERQRSKSRKFRSDIIEEYHGITDEDKAFMTLYSVTDKFAYLVGKKRNLRCVVL